MSEGKTNEIQPEKPPENSQPEQEPKKSLFSKLKGIKPSSQEKPNTGTSTEEVGLLAKVRQALHIEKKYEEDEVLQILKGVESMNKPYTLPKTTEEIVRELPEQPQEQREALIEQWHQLTDNAKRLLVSGLHFNLDIGISREVAIAISGLTEELYEEAEKELLEQNLLATGFAPGIPVPEGKDVSNMRRLPINVAKFVHDDVLKFKKNR